jgi:flavin reductase (DIM6/NTAB) family NADH-FMN oxidoreductase RutF
VYIDLNQSTPAQTYFQMVQTLVPRPVAWVLSENENGSYNLAPFSYFNAVCSNPPLLMLSIGNKPSNQPKDTRLNIEHRKYFTVHIAHREMLKELNESSATLPAGESELDLLKLRTTTFDGMPLPRLEQCRLAYSCECYEIHKLGELPQTIIYGKVNSIYIDDSIISINDKGRVKVHAEKLDPIARLGANEYMTFGNIVSMQRPK